MSPVRPLLTAATLLALTLLAGCGSAPPAPSDRFYRLQTAQPQTVAQTNVVLRSVRADSLYGERAIVYVRSDDPRQLQQYHYHLWLYPPAQAVREYLQPLLDGDRKGPALDVRITHFERILDGKTSRAQAGLEVAVAGAGGTLLEKRYQSMQTAADDSFSAFTMAMEQALQQIYGELLRDLARIDAKAR